LLLDYERVYATKDGATDWSGFITPSDAIPLVHGLGNFRDFRVYCEALEDGPECGQCTVEVTIQCNCEGYTDTDTEIHMSLIDDCEIPFTVDEVDYYYISRFCIYHKKINCQTCHQWVRVL
jgi:hypothetical protein